jgi:hypothetical protein
MDSQFPGIYFPLLASIGSYFDTNLEQQSYIKYFTVPNQLPKVSI